MKTLLSILLIGSIILNAVLLVRHFHVPLGGGVLKQSPDSKYVAVLNSYVEDNRFAENAGERYGLASVRSESISGERIIEFRVSPIATKTETEYRLLKEPVRWNKEGTIVTFETPEYSIYLQSKRKTEPE
tara:strand:- start:415 stop:804 length:390 start_codon:yes stop_codon:yes gene_type:complete